MIRTTATATATADCDCDVDDGAAFPLTERSNKASLPTTVTSGSHFVVMWLGRSAISSPWARTSRAVSSARSMYLAAQ